MAGPQKKTNVQATVNAGRYPPQPVGPPVVVSAMWLLRAGGLVIAAALVAVYLTMCLLFYQGQWQLVFHPSRVVERTPASVGLEYTALRFGADERGHLQLSGWMVPAAPGARYAQQTAVLCHDNAGSLAAALPLVQRLHTVGLNVFAFDYRAYGESDWARPSEQRVVSDAETAIEYLTGTRHLARGSLVLYGEGMGAAVCAEAALRAHVPVVVLENPLASMLEVAEREPRTRLVPFRWLFRERFALAPVVGALPAAKLFVDMGDAGAPQNAAARHATGVHALFASAAEPKQFVDLSKLPDAERDAAANEALRRFLDEYVAAK